MTIEEERDDLVNPRWSEDNDRCGAGEVVPIAQEEVQFWENFIIKYLEPLPTDKIKQEKVYLLPVYVGFCNNRSIFVSFRIPSQTIYVRKRMLGILVLELSYYVLEIPNCAQTTLSQNLIGCRTLSQEYYILIG